MSRIVLVVWNAAEAQERAERLRSAGLVDYKVSATDATWSGLCFARRQPKQR